MPTLAGMRASDLPEVFSRAQALELGLSDERLSGMVRRGKINRLWCGVYATSRTAPCGRRSERRDTFSPPGWR